MDHMDHNKHPITTKLRDILNTKYRFNCVIGIIQSQKFFPVSSPLTTKFSVTTGQIAELGVSVSISMHLVTKA